MRQITQAFQFNLDHFYLHLPLIGELIWLFHNIQSSKYISLAPNNVIVIYLSRFLVLCIKRIVFWPKYYGVKSSHNDIFTERYVRHERELLLTRLIDGTRKYMGKRMRKVHMCMTLRRSKQIILAIMCLSVHWSFNIYIYKHVYVFTVTNSYISICII